MREGYSSNCRGIDASLAQVFPKHKALRQRSTWGGSLFWEVIPGDKSGVAGKVEQEQKVKSRKFNRADHHWDTQPPFHREPSETHLPVEGRGEYVPTGFQSPLIKGCPKGLAFPNVYIQQNGWAGGFLDPAAEKVSGRKMRNIQCTVQNCIFHVRVIFCNNNYVNERHK